MMVGWSAHREISLADLQFSGQLHDVINRMVRRIFGPEREEVAGGWRRLHNEGFYNFYASLNIITVIKSRMR
jgi:hypothetical protein